MSRMPYIHNLLNPGIGKWELGVYVVIYQLGDLCIPPFLNLCPKSWIELRYMVG